MTARTLAEQVPEAVARALDGAVVLTLAEIEGRLPAHIREGRPSKRSVVAAVKALGWSPRKGVDDVVVYRAPQRESDPLAQRDGIGGNVAAEELRLLIERAERLEDEKKGIADDIKDVLGEAKARGYDPKAIRQIMAIRKKKPEEYQEETAILDLYMTAMGMT